jgi:hypothetical protein
MVDSGPGTSIGEVTVTTEGCSSMDALFESMLPKSSVSGGGARNAGYIVGDISRSEKPYTCI